jgi:hypothetical protein
MTDAKLDHLLTDLLMKIDGLKFKQSHTVTIPERSAVEKEIGELQLLIEDIMRIHTKH